MSNLAQVLRDLQSRIALTVARAVVSLVNDDTKMQSLQVGLFKREIRDNVERFQNYGYTSRPFAGAEGVVVFVGGNRDHGLCVAVDDRRYRLTGLADGEVAIYTDEGDKIHLKRGNVIEVTTGTLRVNASTKIELNAPNIELNATTKLKAVTPLFEITAATTTFSGKAIAANLYSTGAVADGTGSDGTGGHSMSGMRTIYNGHHHPETGTTTNTPNEQMT